MFVCHCSSFRSGFLAKALLQSFIFSLCKVIKKKGVNECECVCLYKNRCEKLASLQFSSVQPCYRLRAVFRNINLFVLFWKLNETVCTFEELHL